MRKCSAAWRGEKVFWTKLVLVTWCLIIMYVPPTFNMVISNSSSWPMWSYSIYHWDKTRNTGLSWSTQGRCLFSEFIVLLLLLLQHFSSSTNTNAFSVSAGVVWNNDSFRPALYTGTFHIFLTAVMCDVLYYVFCHKQISAPPTSHKTPVAQ